ERSIWLGAVHDYLTSAGLHFSIENSPSWHVERSRPAERGRRRAGTRACTVERGHPHGPRISIVPRQINGGVAIQYRAGQPLGKFWSGKPKPRGTECGIEVWGDGETGDFKCLTHPTQAPSQGGFSCQSNDSPGAGAQVSGH